ncbi:MAG: hypothetical protein ACR2QC_01580 [Gammaproteobacteria bacterium]
MQTWRARDEDGNLTGPSVISDAPPATGDWINIPEVGPGQILEQQHDGTMLAVDVPDPLADVPVEIRKQVYINAAETGFSTALVNRDITSRALRRPHIYRISRGMFDDVIVWFIYATQINRRRAPDREIPCRVSTESALLWLPHDRDQLESLLGDIAQDSYAKQDVVKNLVTVITSANTHEELNAISWPEWIRKP